MAIGSLLPQSQLSWSIHLNIKTPLWAIQHLAAQLRSSRFVEMFSASWVSAVAGTSLLWYPCRTTSAVLLWEEMQEYGWRECWGCVAGVSPDADDLRRDCTAHRRDRPSRGGEAARLPALLIVTCWGRIMHWGRWLWGSVKHLVGSKC